jgi:hypothetical protein
MIYLILQVRVIEYGHMMGFLAILLTFWGLSLVFHVFGLVDFPKLLAQISTLLFGLVRDFCECQALSFGLCVLQHTKLSFITFSSLLVMIKVRED